MIVAIQALAQGIANALASNGAQAIYRVGMVGLAGYMLTTMRKVHHHTTVLIENAKMDDLARTTTVETAKAEAAKSKLP